MTIHDDHQAVPVPYEGEWVWDAEIVGDDEPGPRPADPQPDPAPHRPRRARRIAHAALTVARAVAGTYAPGVRVARALAAHWLTGGHRTDDEIRRTIVQRQLTAYQGLRETTRNNIAATRTEIAALEKVGAAAGWTKEQRREIGDLRSKADRLRATLADLERQRFLPVQPDPDAIRYHRTHTTTARRGIPAAVGTLAVGAATYATSPALALAALGIGAAGLWGMRYVTPSLAQRAVPSELLIPELDAPALGPGAAPQQGQPDTAPVEDTTPYPLAQATTPDEAAEALRRALLAEGLKIASVTEPAAAPWGWSFRITMASGSPDDLSDKETYKGVITSLRLRRHGLLVEGDPDDGACATVRALLRDPFTPELVGPLPYRPPLSGSVLDMYDTGVGMDSTPMVWTLAGLMLLAVADSGGGKSGIALALAEVGTACRDAAVISLDPISGGVGALGPAITLSAHMDDDLVVAALHFLLDLCQARAAQRARYGWGNLWQVSELHPAILVFVDEWPALSAEAKRLLILLLLRGRKEAVWVLGFSQYGTKDHLGEAIGPKLSGKMIGASRRVDVTDLMGAGALAEGYRADLIEPATHHQKNDAGQVYAAGLPGLPRRPMRWQIREVPAAVAARLGSERAAAGLPDLTYTLTEAGMIDAWRDLVTLCNPATPSGPPPVPPILALIDAAFTTEGDPPHLTIAQLYAHLVLDDPARWGQWDDRDDVLARVGTELSAALKAAGVDLPKKRITTLAGSPTGYAWTAVQTALAAYR
ncbi:hypothetical protein AB0G95_21750 [Streptomyces virginiae]|uniref:hypothetical protein n=1 Tax=Streptomyces virginiae TaxID=1961 RepID=UPI00342484ED